MNLQSLMNHLIVCVVEDIEAQKECLALLEEQEEAVLSHETARIEEATARIERALGSVPSRKARRDRMLLAFAERWSVPATAMTLSSVAERFGSGSERLLELRDQLEAITRETQRLGRKVGALIGVHRRITREVIEAVLTDEHGNPMNDEGTLVDARA